MFSRQLRLIILLGICVVCVLCTDEIDSQGKDIHEHEKPIADETIIEILKTKRAAPKATTPKANKPLVKSACEKSKLQVTCPKGQVIHFLQATYGRKNLDKCNPNKNKKFNIKCKSTKSDKVMREKCHQKRSCTVEASNSVFGDPCRSTIKYLEMQYRCVKEKVTTKTLNTKKTTPKAVTPKKEVTTKISPTKGSTQQITSPKNKETTNILKTEKPTQTDSTSKYTTLEATTSETNTKDATTLPDATLNPTLTTVPTIKEKTEQESTAPFSTTTEASSPTTTEASSPTTIEASSPTTTEASYQTTTTTETPNPTSTKARFTAPATDCDEDDLDCIIDDLGSKPDWFVCETDMGSYPHPTSRKLFIFCLNWKPSVKKCGENLTFSENLMTCVALKT